MKRINLLEALTDNIVVDPAKCIFCDECVNVCVMDNLRMKLAPCRGACPLGVNCQGYVQLISRGEDEKAFEVLTKTLPFPGILARVCHAPCEEKCHHKVMNSEAVAIRTLKRHLVKNSPAVPLPPMETNLGTGGIIAVIGSGPAGMMAAYELARTGHEIVIFEAESAPGGMLRWSIPEFKLPTEVLNNEFDLLAKMGVTIKYGVNIGVDRTLQDIQNEFDAVVVATGCAKHLELGIDGENLEGVLHGLPFLKDVRAGRAPALNGKIVVIGGGNVAVDAAQSAVRLGAESVLVVSLEAENEMPAFPEALQKAQAEGVVFDHSWGPLSIIGKGDRVAGVKLQRCMNVFDADGRFAPRFDACINRVEEADTVIVAIGQKKDTACFECSGLGEKGLSFVDPVTLESSEKGVFVAGDFYSGPSSVVSAMASGKQAAESVRRYIAGEHLRYGRAYEGPVEKDFEIDTSRGVKHPRIKLPVKPCKGKGDFSEAPFDVDETLIRQEASRCYSCGSPFGKYRTCWFCLPCEVECPQEALYVEIPYLLR